jgi:NTE family protein
MMRMVALVLVLALSAEGFDFFGLFKKERPKETVSLVLGSGGARGYAHIGVIEELEARGLKITSIAGASMGALVGGLYAAGKLPEYKAWVVTLGLGDMMGMISLSPQAGGLISMDRVFEKIHGLIGDVLIEELPIKFTAVATDITAQRERHFTTGRLIDAIRASAAIPMVFLPVRENGRLLVDGAVLNPLPLSVVINDGTDYTIAVDVGADIPNLYTVTVPPEMQPRQKGLYEAIFAFFKGDGTKPKSVEADAFTVVRKSLDTAQTHLVRRLIREFPHDLLIQISNKTCDFYEFHRAYEIIETGRLATRDALTTLP